MKVNNMCRFKIRIRRNDEYNSIGTVWLFQKSINIWIFNRSINIDKTKRWVVVYSKPLFARYCLIVLKLD